MRRLVLIGIAAVVAGGTVSSSEARPRLPGILGAVVGTVGGLVGVRHARARAHHRHVASRPWHRPARHAAVARAAAAGGVAATQTPWLPAATQAAPLFWPSLSDDLFAYVFWPSVDNRLWAYGYADIVNGALRPADPRRQPITTTGTAAAGTPEPMPACRHPAATQTADAIGAQLERTVEPTDSQRPAFDDLRAAAKGALAYIDAACPTAGTPTPTARLDAMEDRIWAARQALMLLRDPLDKLYAQLDDAQKAHLDGAAGNTRNAACAPASAPDPTAMLGRQGRPTPEQRAALEAVKTTSAGLARMVAATCPTEPPATALARLDAADRRFNTLLYAVATLRAPVDGLSASLAEAQKSRGATR